MSAYVKVFGRRLLTGEGFPVVLGGRRLKTSKGRNRESEGRPRWLSMGIWPTPLAVAARAEWRIDLDLSELCDPSGVHDRFLNGGEHDCGAWEGPQMVIGQTPPTLANDRWRARAALRRDE